MNWFKIKVQEGNEEYNYCGNSKFALKEIIEQAKAGEFIQLDNLVYLEQGKVKNWNEWDHRVKPRVVINSKWILTIMELRADPRTV